jgi:hypothetical protein
MSSEASLDIADDCATSLEADGQSLIGARLEPRCRVCRNDVVRQKVNDQLAQGASYAMIVRALDEGNSKLDSCDRVTIDSIRRHSERHFPVQNAAKATYREIIERRAREANVDFVDGVATAITPIAFFECIMVKGYETLVAADTKVDVQTAMAAAGKLQAFIDSRSGQTDIADAYVQLNRIIAAVRSTLPEELWPEFLRRLDGDAEPSNDRTYDADADDEEYDPAEFAEDDDDDL